MAFKIISIICIGIVALELLCVAAFFIGLAVATADDGEVIDNSTGQITCGNTGQPCIYSEITPISCNNCAKRSESADD